MKKIGGVPNLAKCGSNDSSLNEAKYLSIRFLQKSNAWFLKHFLLLFLLQKIIQVFFFEYFIISFFYFCVFMLSPSVPEKIDAAIVLLHQAGAITNNIGPDVQMTDMRN